MTKIINMNSESPEDMTKVYQELWFKEETYLDNKKREDYEGKFTNGGLIIPAMILAFITLVFSLLCIFSKI